MLLFYFDDYWITWNGGCVLAARPVERKSAMKRLTLWRGEAHKHWAAGRRSRNSPHEVDLRTRVRKAQSGSADQLAPSRNSQKDEGGVCMFRGSKGNKRSTSSLRIGPPSTQQKQGDAHELLAATFIQREGT